MLMAPAAPKCAHDLRLPSAGEAYQQMTASPEQAAYECRCERPLAAIFR